MPSEDLKARARRIPQELLTQGDVATIPEIFAPGFVQVGTSSSIATWISALRHAFPDLRAMVTHEVVEHPSIAQHLILTGTHRGAYLGVAPTGKGVRWHMALLLREGDEGQFTSICAIQDRLDVLCQLGQTAPRDDLS